MDKKGGRVRVIKAWFFGYKITRFLLWCISIPVLLLHTFNNAYAQKESFYKVQAAYVYHFTKFVTWPETLFQDKTTPFRICVLADNDFEKYFKPLSERTSQERPITISYDVDVSNVQYCHILVVSGQQNSSVLTQMLAEADGYPVLTVSDAEDFVSYGGMIGFVLEGKRVRLTINLSAVNESGLNMSAKLLEVAQYVLNGQGDHP